MPRVDAMVLGHTTGGGVGREGVVKPPMPHVLAMLGWETDGYAVVGEATDVEAGKPMNAVGSCGTVTGDVRVRLVLSPCAVCPKLAGLRPRLGVPRPTPPPTLPPMA